MLFRVSILCLLWVYILSDSIALSSIRVKRQDVSNIKENIEIEFFSDCSCVYSFQCDTNGFVITDGKGLTDDSFGDFLSDSLVRTKRQDAPLSDQNIEIEFFSNCTCVYYYQCDLEGFVITSGKGLIDPRLGKGKTKRILCKGGEFEGEFVCCKHKLGDENKPPVTTEKLITTTNQMQIFTVTNKAKKACGRQLPNINVRIFTDEDELTPVNGEFPWLVAIFKKDTDTTEWKFHASGSLIHPRVILTANHVVVSAKSNALKVIANGQIELSQIGDNPLQERNIKEIIKHPDYNSGMLYNDVALLILESPYNISTTTSVNTLCLRTDISYESKRCLVVGWGRTANTDGTVKVLKKVELPTHSHSKCQEMLAKALSKSSYIFHESLMCAGGEQGKDACKGDGGSPLMCPTEVGHTMYQVGIVAWGIGCGKKDIPGVYANVEYQNNWIVDRLKERDIYIED